ncbi:DUF3300 domain-containing protein [Duganella radicis]|uniref:DUF3300 domain-containing protein n=1 Tax=Duganella radicis TaxID=551988 RepID=A0A6L6PL50_9BURK|nr:DUF3300 domain-containing protein [Duganella radicis]MTV38965.1 DUF3300 domain-containing protein [Duganella radicis]
MGDQTKHLGTTVCSALMLSLLTLAGCNKLADAPPQSAATTPAQPVAPYTPPTAEQLSQMVAPIALFPDKLVGQVLAGATYPEQIAAANQWLAQNPALKSDALQNAENGQPWDVSVKSLTTFPTVLNQMASNMQWTRALGEAYVNDPTDVMNAIQTLRLRAQQAGNLQSSPQLRVSTTVRESPPAYVTSSPSEPVAYSGPAVIPPPPQTIVIEPAEPDVVYVPHYNPAVVYGAPVPVYPGWVYRQPAYDSEAVITTGVLSFGVGVLVGAAVSHHHDWGWNAWGVNWGAPHPGYNGGWQRPAVVYNNSTYISKSVTVVNHVNNINVTNNNYRTNNVINRTQNIVTNNPPPPRPAQQAAGVMTVPHFTARDTVPGSRPPPAAMDLHAPRTPSPITQHELRQPPRVAQEAPRVSMPPPVANKPMHEETRIEHPPVQAMAQAQEHSSAAVHMPPVPHAPMPNHDINIPERAHPQAPRQEMLAMHNERPHPQPAKPAPVKPHVEKHEENNHHHDKRDTQEHHS